jgi:hypothetical protein
VERDAADELNIEMPHVQHTPAAFAAHGKGFYKDIVETGAVGDALLKILSFGRKFLIRELLHARLQVVDCRDDWPYPFDLAIMFGAKNLGKRTFEHTRGYY